MEDIKQYKITRYYLNNGRWFVAFSKKGFNGKRTMPKANYNWLMENPQFEDVPPGYCLHHLDHDETNDDVTNLALMKLNYHRAYHGKQNNGKKWGKAKLRPPVQLGEEPTIPNVSISYALKSKKELWQFRWQETNYLGRRVSRQITGMKGESFRTKKEAEKGKRLFMKIHPHFRKKDRAKIEDLIYQINNQIEPQEMDDAYSLMKKAFPKI